MVTVSAHDLSAILALDARLLQCTSLTEYATAVKSELAELIPSENVVFHLATDKDDLLYTCFSPDQALTAESARYFHDLVAQEYPPVLYYTRTGDARARRISDVATLAEMRRLEIFTDFLRPAGITRQMGTLVPSRFALALGCMFGRGGRDYSDRDAAVLNLLRAPIATTFDSMMLRAALADALRVQDRALGDAGQAVVLLTAAGRVVWSSKRAENWLREYFPDDRDGALPARVSAWLAARRSDSGGFAAPSAIPVALEVTGAYGRLSLRWLPAATAEWDALLLEERPDERVAYADVGLTAREEQVLELLLHGMSNAAIAHALDTSERTVQKHLEHLYRKLDVGSRTAAVAWANARRPAYIEAN